MNGAALIKELEKKYPLCMAESWDNSGFLAGRREKDVKKVYLALDATEQVIQDAKAVGADFLLTHHPMLFSPVKKVNTDDLIGRTLVELIQSDITYYAMHTNYDVVTMGELAADMLGFSDTEILEVTFEDEEKREGFGRTGKLPQPMTLRECGEYVKKVFDLDSVKIFGNLEQKVVRAAVLPGSGKSMVDAALQTGAEVFISGDFGHHDGVDAVMKGLAVIDAGHYGLEHIFLAQMKEFLEKELPELTVYSEKIKSPFCVI